MKKELSILIFLFLVCFTAFAQQDYKSRAQVFVKNGDYDNALKQFNAQKALLDIRKANRNSDEYIMLEKNITRAEACIKLQKKASSALKLLTESEIREAFEACDNEAQADAKEKELLSEVSSARQALSRICEYFPSDAASKAKLAQCETAKNTVQTYRGHQTEILAWKRISGSSDEAEYAAFLRIYPNGLYAARAKSAIANIQDDAAWQRAKGKDSISDYNAYLTSFRRGRHRKEASAAIAKLEERQAWNQATEENTLESFKNYVLKYPSGKHVSQANGKIRDFEEAVLWDEQSRKNTIEGYKYFLSKYPEGKYAKMASTRMANIVAEKDWAACQDSDRITDYVAFQKKHPDSDYAKEAKWKELLLTGEQDYAAGKTVSAYNYLSLANNLKPLTGVSASHLTELQEEKEYRRILDSKDPKEVSAWLTSVNPKSKYAQPAYSNQVSDHMAILLAKELNAKSTDADFKRARGYAKDQSTKALVETKIRAAQVAKKRESAGESSYATESGSSSSASRSESQKERTVNYLGETYFTIKKSDTSSDDYYYDSDNESDTDFGARVGIAINHIGIYGLYGTSSGSKLYMGGLAYRIIYNETGYIDVFGGLGGTEAQQFGLEIGSHFGFGHVCLGLGLQVIDGNSSCCLSVGMYF